ncbi:MAG: ribonuclease HII [Treponema sp.]|jgi:ribonuclease HII|nr:ribonuclease HII [Treponema sp.]
MLCGIDEAGRGPLAGPVCAAAVILSPDFPGDILNDSKKMRPAEREEARQLICAKALAWGVAWATHQEIDEINILRASLLAMRRAFERLMVQEAAGGTWPSELVREIPFGLPLIPPALPPVLSAVVDGLYAPDIPVPCKPMVKADAKVPEVMAASILAKTARDMLMDHYGRLYPAYGYEKHKGYPTREHRARILKYGPSPIQRTSFRVR